MPNRLTALFILTFIFYVNFLARIIIAPFLPQIEQSLALSHGQAGSLFFLLSLGYFPSLLLSGFVSARLSHRMTIAASMLGISGALFLLSTGSSLLFLQAAFFLLGLAGGIYLPSAIATISSLYSAQHWGKAFAVHELAPNMAFLTAPLFASALLDTLSWQMTVRLLSAVTMAAGICYLRFGQGGSLYGNPPNIAILARIVRQRKFHLMVILFSMGISGTIAIYNILPLFLVNVHLMSSPSANLLVSLSRIAPLVTALAGGWLADRFGSRRTMALVLLLTGLSTAAIGLTREELLLPALFLQPVLAVCFFPAGFAVLSTLTSAESRNVAISLTIPLGFVIGGGLIPFLITRAADAGHFAAGIIWAGLFICCGSLLSFFVSSR